MQQNFGTKKKEEPKLKRRALSEQISRPLRSDHLKQTFKVDTEKVKDKSPPKKITRKHSSPVGYQPSRYMKSCVNSSRNMIMRFKQSPSPLNIIEDRYQMLKQVIAISQ